MIFLPTQISDEMHVRFQGLLGVVYPQLDPSLGSELNLRPFIHIRPQNGADISTIKIPMESALDLFNESRRIGTLLKLNNVVIRSNGVLIAEEVAVSSQEKLSVKFMEYDSDYQDGYRFKCEVVNPNEDHGGLLSRVGTKVTIDFTKSSGKINDPFLQDVINYKNHCKPVKTIGNLQETQYLHFKHIEPV